MKEKCGKLRCGDKEVGQEATIQLRLKEGVKSRQKDGGKCSDSRKNGVKARGREELKGGSVTWASRTLGSASRLGAKGWPHPPQSHGAGTHGNSPWQHGLSAPTHAKRLS